MKHTGRMSRCLFLALGSLLTALPMSASMVEVQPSAGAMTWQVHSANAGTSLVVRGEKGFAQRREFEPGQAPFFQVQGDGVYKWQLAVKPLLTEAQKRELRAAGGRRVEAGDQQFGHFESGYFTVQGGVVSVHTVDLDQGWGSNDLPNRQTIAEDLIVQGHMCVGLNCGEPIGFDTILMKDNNIRIRFDDTSSQSGFPANDWQITANDSASGGVNRFSIEDLTAATVPFNIEAGVASHALYVDSSSNIGLGTNDPLQDLHIVSGNSPAIRFEQNTSSSLPAATWDVLANEEAFSIRDSGGRMALRVRPGAPTGSLDIANTGDVGVGTNSPTATLHVSKSTGAILEGIKLSNNNEARISMENTTLAARYIMAVNNTAPGLFFISRSGGGGTIVEVNSRFDAGGYASLKVNGSVQATNVTFSSSRELKEGFSQLDPQEILAKVAELPVSRWRFKEGSQVEHIGPMAEDFHEVFELNSDPTTISMTDTSGVALAAIQGLLQQVKELQQQNAGLTERLQQLEGLVAKQ